MPLQTSGAISLNDIHVEAGGTTQTQVSINDSDVRALISASSGAQMAFSDFYGMPITFSGMTFNNCGQSGRNGPNFTTCDNYYTSTNNSEYSELTNFAVNNGYQSFSIPTGTYTVTMDGACGGSTSGSGISGWNSFYAGNSRRHARGARATFTLTITTELTLTMVCGQKGGDSSSTRHNPGGGGGTFLVAGTYAQIVNFQSAQLICAVGGGGGYNGPQGGTNNYLGGEGQSSQTNVNANSGSNGSAGNGAASATFSANSGGGAGFNTNSGSGTTNRFGTTNYYGLESTGFNNGAIGGQHAQTDYNSRGGFGGGGGGSTSSGVDEDKGGGGGYSGGAYAFDAYNFGNGGGSITNASGLNWSTSSATITRGGGQSLNGQIIFLRQ